MKATKSDPFESEDIMFRKSAMRLVAAAAVLAWGAFSAPTAQAQHHGGHYGGGHGAYYGGGGHHYAPSYSFSYGHHYAPQYYGGYSDNGYGDGYFLSPYYGGGYYGSSYYSGASYGHHYSPSYGHGYGYEIGRAVQQECRDRSRMPSSA
eukprot:TRINITY_DN901_c0_g1_i10.p1 TRINITY_DN901_c0_g1~~TRINITY_DN901_c0_g1_i10.p1  ORF type:complete len:149 (-),score=16.12 TRINITY_DN901_c0_g1_i10:21-467(-)